MATNINGTSGISDAQKIADSSASLRKTQNANEQVSKNEFLKILVEQLKAQDPMNPMQNDQFAVQLAQFSQLEQLISINDKMGTDGNDIASLAGYLGQNVTLNSDKIQTDAEGNGGIAFTLDRPAAQVKIDLLQGDRVVGQKVLTDQGKGDHALAVKDFGVPEGEYSIRIQGLDANGQAIKVDPQISGLVSGFIPGPEGKLIVNGLEVSPASVVKVTQKGADS